MGSGIGNIPNGLYEPRRERAIKAKERIANEHLTPSVVHMPLCLCICLCNVIFISIVLQYLRKFKLRSLEYMWDQRYMYENLMNGLLHMEAYNLSRNE